MLLSSCVVWRHVRFEDFRDDCPHGDERLQRLIWERLDESLAWLESTTGVRRSGTTPRTRARPAGATTPASSPQLWRARRARSGCGESVPDRAEQLVLATGGFPVRVARERGLLVRSNRLERGRRARPRARPRRGDRRATWTSSTRARCRRRPRGSARRTTSALSQLYGGRARVTNERGEEFFPQPPCVARERPRAGDRATARRDGVVRARRSERPEGAGRPRGGRRGRRGGRSCARARRGGRHAHARRASRRRARPSASRGRHADRGALRGRRGRRRRRERRLRERPRAGARPRPRRRRVAR